MDALAQSESFVHEDTRPGDNCDGDCFHNCQCYLGRKLRPNIFNGFAVSQLNEKPRRTLTGDERSAVPFAVMFSSFHGASQDRKAGPSQAKADTVR